MRSIQLLVLCLTAFAAPAAAAIKTEVVEYKQGDTVLQGLLSYDDAIPGRRPAVLVVHNWMGVSDATSMRCEMLAGLGYVALAADVYGKGVRPANAQEAGAEAGKYYKDPALLRARVRAGLDFLAGRPQADPERMAAMGYCFGGKCALELARSGAPIRAAVSFHGALATAHAADAKNFRARVLVLHGADDPYVKPDEVKAFMDEMRAAGVDWQLVHYSGAVHSFTEKAAGNDNGKGAAYNEAADRRSWQAMKAFFAETLGR